MTKAASTATLAPPSNGRLRRHQTEISILQRMVDGALVVAGLWLPMAIYGVPWSPKYSAVALLAVVMFYIAASFTNLYSSWRTNGYKAELGPLLNSWVAVIVSLLALGYLTKSTQEYSRVASGAWFLVAPLLLVGWRVGLRLLLGQLRSYGYNTRTVAIAGATDAALRLAAEIQANPDMGLRLAGIFDGRKPGGKRASPAAHWAGDFDSLVAQARNRAIDLVYIALPLSEEPRIKTLMQALSDTSASVYITLDLFGFDLMHGALSNVGFVPVVSVFESPHVGLGGWIKRLEDVAVASVALMIFSLPMLFIALAIKLTSAGPVIFKQRRYGLDGDEIYVWKFRTMTCCEDGDTIAQASRGDARITKLGAFLRRYSLDELPQFINVLQGHMSVVGPRPHAVAHNEQYRGMIDRYMVRHKVKPGITGWAQINGWRGETDKVEKMEKRVQHDFEYIANWSLWIDIKIVLLTVTKGFITKHAY